MYRYGTSVTTPRYAAVGPPPRRGPEARWWKAGAGLVAVLLAAVTLVLVQRPEPAGHGAVLVIANVDGNVAGNGLELATPDIAAAAAIVAARGGGTLTVLIAAGGAAQAVATAHLAVEREGEPETDTQVRDRVVAERVGNALTRASTARLSEPGRNLLPLFSAVAERAPNGGEPFEVFYVGFGLATVDPTDARIALAGEPGQAVDAIRSQLPALPGARLHVVFPAAAGPQPELNTITSAWRTEYWKGLVQSMGATLASIVTTGRPAPPAADVPSAPVIPNLPDPTPVPPGDPGQPPTPDSAPVLFGSGSFLPDSDRFADPDAAARALAPLAAAWAAHPGEYSGAECIGRTAAIGPADSARNLSEQRAERAAALLRDGGVTPVTATGVGFDDPLPDFPPTDPHQRSVVCRLIPQD